MSKILSTSFAALWLAAIAAQASAPANAARFCAASITGGEATAATEEEAKKAATVWWSSRAGALGEGYETWDDARDKSVTCHPGPRNTFKCIAAGRPCLPDGVTPDTGPKQDL